MLFKFQGGTQRSRKNKTWLQMSRSLFIEIIESALYAVWRSLVNNDTFFLAEATLVIFFLQLICFNLSGQATGHEPARLNLFFSTDCFSGYSEEGWILHPSSP